MPENLKTHSEPVSNQETSSNPELFSTLESNAVAERQLGAATLAAANFDSRHKEIVDSSFNKARESGEKLPGKNNERRNYAYLSRLEKLIDKYGNEAEKKLWQASIKDNLLIDYDNIPESYWQAKRQELRDNGYGDIELTEDYKRELFNKERELQEESLEKWVNYLGDEHSPYPLWFKIYAWDGMTKMGKYDKSKGKYATRNETTVAPYPNPDAEVLGGVFEVVNRYYGNNEREFYTEEGDRNIDLEKVVQSGSFAKIYNAIEHDIAPIIEPPEKAEDVHGTWVEYSIGEEDDIARAARGTGWCVASPSVGRHYLEYGTYGQDNDWDDDEDYDEYYDEDQGEDYDEYYDEDQGEDYDNYGEPVANEPSVKSKFILFHLQDPSTGRLSKNAVASIRLDPDGQVAEISGLKEGQALNDSLVDMVAEKVKTLPGGEKFLEAFADKQELIRLDRKMQNDEDLTKEELEFIYEINRPTRTLDTYNGYDPRINELKEKYNIGYALNANIDANKLVSNLGYEDIVCNLDDLIKHGVNVDDIVSRLRPYDLAKNLAMLIDHGANIDVDKFASDLHGDILLSNLATILDCGANVDNIVSRLGPNTIADDLAILIDHGANIDVDGLVSDLHTSVLLNNLATLVDYGASMDNIMSHLSQFDIADNLTTLIEHGANIDNIISSCSPRILFSHLTTLIDYGASMDNILSRFRPHDLAENLAVFINHGANIDNIVSRLDPNTIAHNLTTLIDYGANIDNIMSHLGFNNTIPYLATLIEHGANIDNIVSNLNPYRIPSNLTTLIDHGANVDNIASHLDPLDVARNLTTLIEHGANIDVDELVSRLRPGDLANRDLTVLINHGANVDNIASHLNPRDVIRNLTTLIDHGANIDFDELVSRLDPDAVADNLDTLIDHGADINNIVSNLKPYAIAEELTTLINHGANIDIDDLLSRLEPSTIAYNLATLIEHGANIDLDELVSRLDSDAIKYNLDTLIDHGADINNIVSNLKPHAIAEKLTTLIDHGVNIDIDDLLSHLNSFAIAHNLATLIEHGANIDNIVSHLDPDRINENIDVLRAHGWQG